MSTPSSRGTPPQRALEVSLSARRGATSALLGKSLLLVLATCGLVGAGLSWRGEPGFFEALLGLGVAISAFAFQPRPRVVVSVTGHPAESRIRLRTNVGADVELARSAVEGARVERHVSSSTRTGSAPARRGVSWRVVLLKRDLGRIELTSTFTDQERSQADAVAAQVEAMLAAVPATPELERAFVDEARQRLSRVNGLSIREESVQGAGYRDAGSTKVELAWPMKGTLRASRAGLQGLAGATAMAYGFGRMGAWPVYGLAAILAGLWVWSMWRLLAERSLVQRVSIDDREMVIRETKGAHTVKSHAMPLAKVGAVDLSWEGRLAVRDADLTDKLDWLVRATTSEQMPDTTQVLYGISAMMRGTHMLSSGSLDFAALADLETVLGAEIAARTGRDAGAL